MRLPLSRRGPAGILLLALAPLWGTVAGTALAQPGQIDVALAPADTVVTPGADFWVAIDVTAAAASYNVWEGVVAFDPAALTFVPTNSDFVQQGCLMIGTCSDAQGTTACGATYLDVRPAADSVYVGDGLLCNQIRLTGPGRLFRFHFRASTTSQVTFVRIRRILFAGQYLIRGIVSADAIIGIGHDLTGVEPPLPGYGIRMSAAPNPARGAVTFAVESEASGEQVIAVHDVSGRLVRVVSRGWQAAGTHQMRWDGTDDSGSRVAPGFYLATLREGGRQTQIRVTVLE